MKERMFWILKQITALNFINFKFTPRPNLKVAKLPLPLKPEVYYLLLSGANKTQQLTTPKLYSVKWTLKNSLQLLVENLNKDNQFPDTFWALSFSIPCLGLPH